MSAPWPTRSSIIDTCSVYNAPNAILARAPPQTPLRRLQLSPRLPGWGFKGLTYKGKEKRKKRRGKEGKMKEREGKGTKKGKKSGGRKKASPYSPTSPIHFSDYATVQKWLCFYVFFKFWASVIKRVVFVQTHPICRARSVRLLTVKDIESNQRSATI